MIKNNILLALRQLRKNKVFSLVNVLGLSLSMVATLIIFKYVSYEQSYDDHHEEAEQIYRLYRSFALDKDANDGTAQVFSGIAPIAKNEIPEFAEVSRFIGYDKIFQSFALTYIPKEGDARTFNIGKAFYADDDALKVFTFNWTEESGQPSLANPGEVVISRSMAEKFFSQSPAVGKVLKFKNQGMDMKVTGVFEDQPDNTHFKYDVLCSFTSLPASWDLDNSFSWGNFYIYSKLTKGASTVEVDKKLNDLLKERGTWFAEEGELFKLMPMKDIHLKSNQTLELEANGSERTVTFLTIIGVFIMLIAWVNYINLSTAKLIERAKEVGVRKVLGSYKSHLIQQFMIESLIMNFIAIVLTFTILQSSVVLFESLLGIPLSFFSGEALSTTLLFAGIFTLGALFFGFYPALLFSRLKITSVLKGRSKHSKSSLMLRRVLTIFQFSVALILIIGTLTVFGQLRYMQQKSIGMNIDQTLVLKKPFIETENRGTSQTAFMNSVRQLSGVQHISATSEIPGNEISYMRWIALGPLEDSKALYAKDISIDDHFTNLFDIEVLHGRSFAPEFTDTASVVLNLSAAKELLGAEADFPKWINKTIYYETRPVKLIGVINDISQRSLKVNTEPHIYMKHGRTRYYSVKLEGGTITNTLAQLERAFHGSFANSHFDYFFLDEYFNRQYAADRLFGKIFTFFSVLAIIITVLGLFGLSIYNVGQRAKEVSIRRVLGASFQNISLLLTKDYFRLILIATVLAIPLGYFMADQWLANFANRMDISVLLFLLPVVMVVGLTLLTVGYQVVKAAIANPADTLRWE